MHRLVYRFCARRTHPALKSSRLLQQFPKTLQRSRSQSTDAFSSCLASLVTKLKTRFLTECPDDCVCIGNRSNRFEIHMGMETVLSSDTNADVVKVFHGDEEKNVEIVMKLYGSIRTIQRSRCEPLQKSLDRIATNVKNANAKLERKKKKKLVKDRPDTFLEIDGASPKVTLHDHKGEMIDEELGIIEAWEKGSTLKICDYVYRVVVNPPKVQSIKLVRTPIAGIPIYPQLQLRLATIDQSRFEWFRRLCQELDEEDTEMDIDEKSELHSGKHKMDSSDCESISMNDSPAELWEKIGEDVTYTASEKDVGYKIRLKVYPGSERYPHNSEKHYHANPVLATTEGVVITAPEKLLCAERVNHTAEKCEKGSFRFVCYNILADVYSSTEYAHDFLFPYCPQEAMDIDYRQQLILKELIGYNSDVVCLQEMDRSVFESYFMPAMSLQGYAGAFAAKEGIKEGVALFYRRERFRLLSVDNIILRRAFKEERNKDLYQKIGENEDFLKNFMSKPTCLLVGVLASLEDSNKKILIGNTHLYWHPHGCHIRLIQVELILREMRRLHTEFSEKYSTSTLSCIITGDFNSNPYSGAVKLLTDGEVPSNHADWYSMGKSEYLPGLVLTNPKKFTSACGYPKYSNYVTRFQNLLDYIFVDDLLQVDKVIPQPSHEMILCHTALPNVTAPSDHIAQVVDLSWKT